jgi:hypothetical protein
MKITGKITGIKYKAFLAENLRVLDIKNFNISKSTAYFIMKDSNNSFAVSKWVSPKRTRSYPYERVYNTLNVSKKITIIPIIKDEGADGDRDFLQWDTISLMSLLDVFVIFAYYNKATRNMDYNNKITDFEFNNKYIISKIKEVEQYHSSALHWNLNELKKNFHRIIDKSKEMYSRIEKELGVKLHNQKGIDNFKNKIGKNVEKFMRFSREKAEKAQSREIVTTQPKESLSTLTKAKITITNYLGGQYFFTVDEVFIDDKNIIYLIESKHSKKTILPSKSDIKDGLLKMILYSNLTGVKVEGKNMKSKALLSLTSKKLKGQLSSNDIPSEKIKFFSENNFSQEKLNFIYTLFKEASENNFIVKMGYSK